MSRHLPKGALHWSGGDPQSIRPLVPAEMVQWELDLQDEEQEAREAAEALVEERDSRSEQSSSPSAHSHRRQRQLAEHHKHYLGATSPENQMRRKTATA